MRSLLTSEKCALQGYVTTPVYGHLSGPEKEKNVRNFIQMVQTYQACGYKYIYIGASLHSGATFIAGTLM